MKFFINVYNKMVKKINKYVKFKIKEKRIK